jgi:pimeloyl-ACP methyl ester carboxylesterase
VLADLVPHFEVIAPTLPGHDGGPPFAGNGSPSVARIADALERQLDELGIGAAHLVGNSLGGALAIELAKRGRARSVLAISPAFGWELDSPHTERVARIFVRLSRTARIALPHIDRIARSAPARRIAFGDAMRRGELVSPTEAADLTRAVTRCPLIDTVLQAPDKEALLPQDLDRVAAPVLLAWAEHDRMIPAATCSSRYRREIPDAEFQLLRGVGHVPMWDRQLVIDTIRTWIDRHPHSQYPPPETSLHGKAGPDTPQSHPQPTPASTGTER